MASRPLRRLPALPESDRCRTRHADTDRGRCARRTCAAFIRRDSPRQYRSSRLYDDSAIARPGPQSGRAGATEELVHFPAEMRSACAGKSFTGWMACPAPTGTALNEGVEPVIDAIGARREAMSLASVQNKCGHQRETGAASSYSCHDDTDCCRVRARLDRNDSQAAEPSRQGLENGRDGT